MDERAPGNSTSLRQQLEATAERIRQQLSEVDSAREKVLRLCREIIRYSAGAIRAAHRRDTAEANDLLQSALRVSDEVNQVLSQSRGVLHTGFVHDAQKELAEASATLAIINGEPLPDPDRLQIGYAAYLNGLGEALGELRRYLLDSLRRDELGRCEDLLATMDEVYGVLVTMDFPDAITFGLRRTTDVVRGIIEKTRADLTLIMRQKQLETRLEGFERRLPPAKG